MQFTDSVSENTPIMIPKTYKVYHSYGVICFSKDHKWVLLVSKKSSYGLNDANKILSSTNNNVLKAFTSDIIDRLYLYEKDNLRNCMLPCMQNLSINEINEIRRRVSNSTKFCKQIIEMPKGHKKKYEDETTAALRELKEETSIDSHNIRRIDDNIYETCIVDNGVKYVCRCIAVEYLGEVCNNTSLHSCETYHEVSSIYWMPIEKIRMYMKHNSVGNHPHINYTYMNYKFILDTLNVLPRSH